MKRLLDEGAVGDVVSIKAIENVGYWNQAHSFVSGNWRNAGLSSPMILQKCCHDMDLYLWLAGKTSRRVSSFGSNFFFTAANAPEGAARRCTDGCKARENCPFDAEKIYLRHPRLGIENGNTGWPNEVLALNPTPETIAQALRDGPYGRCVFHCDNDVVDHQVVNVEMTDGSTLSFTMCGFTEHNTRCAKFMGTGGELIADMQTDTVTLRPFGQPAREYQADKGEAGHGGGDAGIVGDFIRLLHGETPDGLTSLDVSLESHYVALAAEASRLNGGEAVDIDVYRSGAR